MAVSVNSHVVIAKIIHVLSLVASVRVVRQATMGMTVMPYVPRIAYQMSVTKVLENVMDAMPVTMEITAKTNVQRTVHHSGVTNKQESVIPV